MNKPGIYRIWCVRSNKSYVGSSTTACGTRIRTHFHRLRRGNHHSSAMQEDWNKFGESEFRFEVLKECGPGECEAHEASYCEAFNCLDPLMGYNLNNVYVETPGKKRGRKRNVIPTKGYYRRVTNDVAELLDKYLLSLKGGREPEIPAFTEAKTAKEAIAQPYKEVEELKALNWKLVEENAALVDEVAGLKVELEECRNLTLDEKSSYWKARALKAEAYAASKNE